MARRFIEPYDIRIADGICINKRSDISFDFDIYPRCFFPPTDYWRDLGLFRSSCVNKSSRNTGYQYNIFFNILFPRRWKKQNLSFTCFFFLRTYNASSYQREGSWDHFMVWQLVFVVQHFLCFFFPLSFPFVISNVTDPLEYAVTLLWLSGKKGFTTLSFVVGQWLICNSLLLRFPVAARQPTDVTSCAENIGYE